MERVCAAQPNRVTRRKLLSFLLAAGFVLITFLLLYPCYLNNDDTNIAYALAGYRTGTPYPSHPFVHVALARVIAALYTAVPTVAWWAVFQIAVLTLSLWVLFDCILRVAARARASAWVGVLLCTVLYWVLFLYAFVRVTFTLTSGFAGMAAMALLLSADTSDRRETVRAYVGAGCLLVLCYLIRNSAGNSMLCFVGGAVFFRLLNTKGARVREVLAGAGIVLIALTMTVTFRIGVRKANTGGFAAFDAARGHFADYPHISYADDPALFESLGWDETTDALANKMCYLDPAITADALETVASVRVGREKGIAASLIGDLITYFRGSGMSQVLVVAACFFLLVSVTAFCIGRSGLADVLTAVLMALGTVALISYLTLTGRLPVRVFQLIAFPAVASEAIFAVRLVGLNRAAILGKTRVVFLAVMTAAALAVTLWGGRIMANEILPGIDGRRADNATVSACEAYVLDHPDNIYFINAAYFDSCALFTVYPDGSARPTNLIDWGGTCWLSGWKTEQHALNGLAEAPTAEVFRRENVYLIAGTEYMDRSDEKLRIFCRYLNAHFGTVTVETVDQMPGGYAVYHFTFGEDNA